jgi:hypothetical protein
MHRGNSRERDEDDDRDDENPEPSAFDTLTHELGVDLRGLRRSFETAVRVEWLRFKTRMLDSGISLALYLFLFGFGLIIVFSAAAFIANAIRDSLGNLGAGFAILGAVLVLILSLRIYVRASGARKARRALEESEES